MATFARWLRLRHRVPSALDRPVDGVRAAQWLIDHMPEMSGREIDAWLARWPYDRTSRRVAELTVGRGRPGG